MKLSDAGTVREYIKGMTETFDELSAIGDPTTDEDKVVYLLAGLPESYDVLVTALESGTDAVPSMETVTERLLREEQKLKDREDTDDSEKLLLARYKKQSGPFTCHYCKKPGHSKRIAESSFRLGLMKTMKIEDKCHISHERKVMLSRMPC